MKQEIEILAIYTSPAHDFKGHHGKERGNNPTPDNEEIECVANRGIVGDRYFDFKENFKGQITFFAQEVLDSMSQFLNKPDIERHLVRRNVITQNIDLNTLIDKEFTIGDVTFRGSEECAPCYWMNTAIAPGAEAFLKNQGGLRARILTSGKLSKGKYSLTVC